MRALGFGVVVALGFSVACGSEAPTVGPTDGGGLIGRRGGALAFGTSGVQCSDAAPVWVTTNYSTGSGAFTAVWLPAPGVETYEVEVQYSRDGVIPPVVLSVFRTNRTEVRLLDSEHGGRYYVRVRVVHTLCGDVDGAWSNVLTLYGDIINGAGPSAPPVQCALTCDDDDEGEGDGDDELVVLCHAPKGASSGTVTLTHAEAVHGHLSKNKDSDHPTPGHWWDHLGPCLVEPGDGDEGEAF